MSEMYREAIRWWAKYLSVFALNPPWGITGKFTVGVPASVGNDIARLFGKTPRDVLDAVGRPCLQVEIEDNLIVVEWLRDPPTNHGGPTGTWGGGSKGDPLDRYYRNEKGELKLKKPWSSEP